MKRRIGISLAVVCALCLPALLYAATVHVPGDQPTIQAGIDAAIDGDVVLIADGTYIGEGNKDLDFNGKAITVRSENGAAACIIDCETSGRGVTFQNGETETSVLWDVTIQNGRSGGGGGIRCDGASPIIGQCVLFDNRGGGAGTTGGIHCIDSSPWIVRCSFLENKGVGFDAVGGLWCEDSTPVITGCIFHANWGGGTEAVGAIRCVNSPVTIINCLFRANTGGGVGGTGGVQCVNCAPQIQNCTFAWNGAGAATGGGAFFCGPDGDPTLINCILWNNTPYEIYADGGQATVSYSDIRNGWPGAGNINVAPEFASGPYGIYYLDQTASPCIDAGSDLAENICFQVAGNEVCMSDLTTHPDGLPDSGQVDMGAHYPLPLSLHDGDVDGDGAITPNDAFFALLFYLEIPAPGSDETAADFCPRPNGDGVIDPGDCYGIVRAYLAYPDPCD